MHFGLVMMGMCVGFGGLGCREFWNPAVVSGFTSSYSNLKVSNFPCLKKTVPD